MMKTTVCPYCREKVADGDSFCPRCGTRLFYRTACPACERDIAEYEEAKFCPYCGTNLYTGEDAKKYQPPNKEYAAPSLQTVNTHEEPNIAACIAAALIPFIGFVLWLAYAQYKPRSAKTYGIVGLVSMFVWALILFVR